jgi:hypothetical protein
MQPAVYDEARAAAMGQEWMALWDRTVRGKGAALAPAAPIAPLAPTSAP